jgi:TP901 family phage tail tape measure protein
LALDAAYRIGWIGDEAGLSQFVTVTRSGFAQIAQAAKAAQAEAAALRTGAFPSQAALGTNQGIFVKNLTSDIDAYNGVIKTTTTLGVQMENGMVTTFKKFTGYTSSTKELDAAVAHYKQTQEALVALQARSQNVQAAAIGVAPQRAQLDSQAQQLKSEIATLQQQASIEASTAFASADRGGEILGLPSAALLAEKQQQLTSVYGQMGAAQTNYQKQMIASAKAAAAENKIIEDQLVAEDKAAAAEISAITSGQKGPTSVLPTNVLALQARSKQLYAMLQQQGLGAGGPESLYPEMGTNIGPITKNLRTGMYEVRGEFQDFNKVNTNFAAEFDKDGNVITRFGGQMSGLGSMIRQTGRDFQKVIEWTIATTAVIGTMGMAMQKIQQVAELDTALRKFSLTANLSMGEARSYFTTISDVANTTATPILEMLSAMDDIALATQRAGQTAQQWQESIQSVAYAVGVLTNIANMTTVEATDALTAIMKQLSLAPQQLMDVENKIAAVAGGQSNAISDITKGLSVMAQAGTQAQMSIDQQIGAIQTLSQVTAKTPSEVATSFKNLVGSIDSTASVKELNKFGIAVRDEAGNMRPFLDIYGDIKKAITEGIIPAGQEKEVVKAISGGPRRAPDAAALLEAYDQIAAATSKAENATNEAEVANARIVSSMSAQFTIFQNELTEFVFNKFGGALSGLANSLVPTLNSILTVLNALAPVLGPILNLAKEFLIAAIAAKAFAGLKLAAALLEKDFKTLSVGIAKTFSSEIAATNEATAATEKLGAAITEDTAKLNGMKAAATEAMVPIKGTSAAMSFLGGKGGIAAGLGIAGIAAAGSIATGGGITQDLGNNLTMLGMGITMVQPELAALGITVTGVGLAMSLFGKNTEETAAKEAELQQQQLSTLQNIKSLQDQYGELTASQQGYRDTMDQLENKVGLTADETSQLTSAQSGYYTVAAQLVGINTALYQSYNELDKVMPDLASKYPDLAAKMLAAKSGFLSQEEVTKLTMDLLNKTNPQQFPLGQQANITLPTMVWDPTTGKYVSQEAGGRVNAGVVTAPMYRVNPITNQVYAGTGNMGANPFGSMTQGALVSGSLFGGANITDPFKTLQDQVTQQQALINILSQTTQGYGGQEALKNTTAYSSLMGLALTNKNAGSSADMQNTIKSLLTFSGPMGSMMNENLSQSQISKLFTTIQTDEAEATLKGDDLKKKLDEINHAPMNAQLAWWDTLRGDAVAAQADLTGVSEDIAKIDDAMQAAKTNQLSDIAQQYAQLQVKKLSGGTSASDLNQINAQLNALDSTLSIYDKLDQMVLAYGQDGQGAIDMQVELGRSLSNLPGLEDAQSLTMDQLIPRLFSLAQMYGLNSDQITTLMNKMYDLASISKALTALRDKYSLTADMDLTPMIAKLKSVRDILLKNPMTAGEVGDINAQIHDLEQVQKLQTQQTSITTDMSKIFNSGKGSNFGNTKSGGGGSTSSMPAPSLLDIPTAIVQSGQMSNIIKQAINNALTLQHQVPGADKAAANDIVELLNGTQKVLEVKGIQETILSKALQELADIEQKRLDFETKADTIRRIRVGGGDFSAIANVPLNSTTGVSVGGSNQINVTLNINGTVLTPAQLSQFADLVGSSIKRQIAGG